MSIQTLVRSISFACLSLGFCQTAAAQTIPDVPYAEIEAAIRTVTLQTADLLETAGYPDSANGIRAACSEENYSLVPCLVDFSAYGGTFLIFREHEIVGTFYQTIGQDEIARDYAHCEEDPGTFGESTEFGSIHCTEQLATDPFWVGFRTAVFQLADLAETAGYGNAAREMREDCEYPGPVGACGIAAQHLVLAIVTGAGVSTAMPACQSKGLITRCPTLRPVQVNSLADLGVGRLDQTGDGLFSVADLSLLSGSRLSLDTLIGGLLGASQSEQGAGVWSALDAIAKGPAVASGTPVADDYYNLLQSLAALSSTELMSATPRRAARLSP